MLFKLPCKQTNDEKKSNKTNLSQYLVSLLQPITAHGGHDEVSLFMFFQSSSIQYGAQIVVLVPNLVQNALRSANSSLSMKRPTADNILIQFDSSGCVNSDAGTLDISLSCVIKALDAG